ncbi:MAG: DUF4190 domain-containing protein [Ruminococcus sp.]|nr:DUF4190 domain-containing protein [Ruminococcus sp.]
MNPQEPQNSGGVNYYRLPEKKPKQLTLAIMSFVFSLIPVLLCCCTIYPAVTVFLLLLSVSALVFGIISLAARKDGKGFAITGVIVSVFMIAALLFSLIFLSGPYSDMMTFSEHAQEYVDEYEQTGEVPEEFDKYNDPKYDWFWHSMGMESFDDFYGDFIGRYKAQNSWMLTPSDGGSSSRSESSSESSQETTTRPANYGEDPITI